jgi:hypothetical protein
MIDPETKAIRDALNGWRSLPVLRDAIELYQNEVEPATLRARVIEALRVDLDKTNAWESQEQRENYLAAIVSGLISIQQ